MCCHFTFIWFNTSSISLIPFFFFILLRHFLLARLVRVVDLRLAFRALASEEVVFPESLLPAAAGKKTVTMEREIRSRAPNYS
jgi:hypothetical protein